METPREICQSVYRCITEIDNRFGEFTREFDAGYAEQRKILQRAIDRADRQGNEFTLAASRKELAKVSKSYYQKRRAKFTYLLTSICAKHGRNVNHIVRVAGYNYRTKNVKQ